MLKIFGSILVFPPLIKGGFRSRSFLEKCFPNKGAGLIVTSVMLLWLLLLTERFIIVSYGFKRACCCQFDLQSLRMPPLFCLLCNLSLRSISEHGTRYERTWDGVRSNVGRDTFERRAAFVKS